jgi:glyoxylase-like metal-dependent hydrolase (beta-lactamase superfamily II)
MDIHPVSNGYSTAYLVVDGGKAMLVDASTTKITPKVLARLAQAGAELKLIVLTHYHYDHVGAASALRDATGARVAIHRLDADALRRGGKLRVNPTRLQARALAPLITRAEKAPVIPDLELGDDEDLRQHGGFGRTLWTPGHTAGSQCVLLPDGTVLAGDALTEAILPPHSAKGPLFAEDPDASRSSIAAIANAATGKVHVAHRGRLNPRSLKKLAAPTRTGPWP